MEGVIGEAVEGVKGGDYVTIEVGGGEEEDAVDGREVGLVGVVVFVVELGRLGEVFWEAEVSDIAKGGEQGGQTLEKVHARDSGGGDTRESGFRNAIGCERIGRSGSVVY